MKNRRPKQGARMSGDSDEDIVQQVVEGTGSAYALLVGRYQRPVFNLMYRYCRSEEEAADLSQDVFLRAYERLSSFDCRRKFFPWLYTLALNRAKDWQRSNARKLKELARLRWETEPIRSRSQQEEQLLNREEVQSLYGALDTLTDTTREIVLLRFREELPIRDLAEIFGLSESAVKMRILRGLNEMKSILGGDRDERQVG